MAAGVEPIFLERLKTLKDEIRSSVRNQLTYPKVVLELWSERSFSPEELLKAQKAIDRIVVLIEAKVDELIDELEQSSAGFSKI